MKNFLLILIAIVSLTMIRTATSYSGELRWVTAYITDWDSQRMPVSEIEWTGITHFVHFNMNPQINPPYYTFPSGQSMFEQGCWNPCGGTYQADLVNAAHARGVKAILCLGGVGGDAVQAWEYLSADSARCQTAVTSMLNYARTKGYDGVDIDWEEPNGSQRGQFSLLVRTLRRTLDSWTPRGLLTIAVPREYGPGFDVAMLNAHVDQVNLMSYDCNGWWSSSAGFHAPLYNPSPNWQNYPSESGALNMNDKMPTWINAGLNPAQMGVGLAFYGYSYDNITTPGQHGSNFNYIWQFDIVNNYLTPGIGTRRYDSLAHQPYLSVTTTNPTKFINYDDEISLPYKVNWAKSRNLGGVMVFTINTGYNPSKPAGQRHPLMRAVRNTSGTSSVEGGIPPGDFALEQNYPNPFNPTTTIRFTLPVQDKVKLGIFNLLGKQVRTLVDGIRNTGLNEIEWDGRDDNYRSLSSGTYFYRLQSGNFSEVRKMILLK